MAEDQVGMRKDVLQQLAPWTKLFSAFKVALDPKKLLLAGAGIFVMQLGWWALSAVYFNFSSAMPEWNKGDYVGKTPEEKNDAWKRFKRDRQVWNLKYEMAGTPPEKDGVPQYVQYDIGDLAETPEDFDAISAEKEKIDNELARLNEPIKADQLAGTALHLMFGSGAGGKHDLHINLEDKSKQEALLADLRTNPSKYRVRDLSLPGEGKNPADSKKIVLGPYEATTFIDEEVQDVRKYKMGARTVEDIKAEIKGGQRKAHITNAALELRNAKYKAYGRLRTLPWFEDRGPNPYLVVSGNYRSNDGSNRYVPWAKGEFFAWALGEEAPVLLEPLIKFFRPIIYLFDPAAGFWNRVYLFLVIAWGLATWALFGGAISRIAAVQVARANERVGLTESLRFTWARYKSYFFAPLFPLLFLFIIAFVLLIFGLLEAWTFVVGDIVGGLLWPLVFLAGLIMAVVLVGLVGWPLMYTTISAEGSDSFDAISRSYSYIYQAPWHYLWYGTVALVYGAVLVFFVGLMGSMTVYLGKWAVALAPTTESRDPGYLFQWAPTSYGWRDLLLWKESNVETREEVNNRGVVVTELAYNTNPKNTDLKPNWHNYVGTFLVTIWLYLIFLLVIGFSYSYFWSASTIIYLLMRKKVDETELDEIHLEEEPEQPFPAPAAAPPPPANAVKAAGQPVQMVESPTLRTSVTSGTAPPAAATPPAAAVEPTPAAPPPATSSTGPAPIPMSAPPATTPEPAKETPPGDGSPPAGGTH
jgi:hypothetical protein